jgi:hypothetical protein
MASDLLNEWEKETNRSVKTITYNGFVEEYIDGVDYGKPYKILIYNFL